MFTENSIKALLLIAEGFKTLAESIAVGGELLPVVEETTEKDVESEVSEEAEAEEESDAEESSESEEEDLESLSYNELKKRAKEAGVSATGNRKELIEKIRNAGGEESEPEAEEQPQEEKKPVVSKKSAKKVEEPEDDEEDNEDAEEDEAEEPTTQELVEKAVADMSDDELREVLEDVELSTKGKRTALISRIVTAVDEGVITLDADDGDESEDESDSDSEDGDITSDMTPERKEAYETLCEETEESFNSGEITRDDLIGFLAEFNEITAKKAKTQYKDTEDAELLAEYLKTMALFVSDEGEVIEEGAYTINEEAYCCGHVLTYDEKSETYKCEICGEEYDAE